MTYKEPGGDPHTQCLTTQLSSMGVRAASESGRKFKIPSGIEGLDQFLEGGIPLGAVSEWGVPLGGGGREVILSWLNGHHTKKEAPWALWVSGHHNLRINPPAWLARGVALSRTRFAWTSRPLVDLKPVFMESPFQVIVIDSPRSFTEEDCAFLAPDDTAVDLVPEHHAMF